MTSVTAEPVETAARAPRGFAILLRLLASNWTFGRLTVLLPNGERHLLDGPQPGLSATLDIRDYRFARRVLASGDIGFAEGYMAGEWESPQLATLLEVLARNHQHIRRLIEGNPVMKAVHWLSHRMNRNNRSGSRKNIHAHYDLGNAFYSAWLDPTMTYSSARFTRDGLTLEAAQREKYASLARAMDLRSGQSVLEIGCGWGGFAEFAAKEIGARVTGITISREQYDFARQRIFNAGLTEQVDIRLIDYRDVEGRFDRVASIEMFEAVGMEYWPAYFGKIHDVLEPGGVAGLQIITIDDALFGGYNKRTDFIQKYIFPGGMLPSEESLRPVIDRAGLDWRDVERFGQDYAETLKLWDERFQGAWGDIRRMGGFDERFRRLWRFYLAYCEAGFRSARTDVIQLALTRP
ncbi:MAG: cyclopropane-fatty-acyl-phospholipid synthase family protein [Brevundimonas sp.]|uniref:SAM-dependent methyltransferase n=1 Tax=Brevundimonas sp. TaxID=1871086 RepID=UPI00273318DD|nr:cyclopropane-fatty-acyl-phospholipid synthase family protein [Brevundimonas sp.]MDP3656540.1 cyclopropane-fatty-acyl-phospholipid synthase family protein [Brevundimonas sp.]MDZ4111115.1 cyclopropane-fatty-acyl-phospholipid synthase family protein [Brevundimonas sp.]